MSARFDDQDNFLVQPEARSPLGRLPGLLHHLAGERPVTVDEMNEAVKQRAAKRFRKLTGMAPQ